ncbi:MAG: hypothetical protein HPAVJP_2020 [Candidatus Hepatoplasma vulgare]|nr:MAG: hypothetical protein HPAVJP_2020 [Candidatus Hepatoplasma sp.]
MDDAFFISFIVIFFVFIFLIIGFFYYKNLQFKKYKKDFFSFYKYILIIDIKRKTLNLRVFEKNQEFLWTRNIKISDFLKKFQYESKNSKNFFTLLNGILKLNFLEDSYKDFFKNWRFYNKNFLFYSTRKNLLGRNIFSNLILDLYVKEEDLIYAHGNYINFKKLNIEKLFTEKDIEIIKEGKIENAVLKDIEKKKLKKHFLINIFDLNIEKNNKELNSFSYFLIYIFAIWMKKEKFENIYITSDYNIYILLNKAFYTNNYLNNRYWYEKINIIYNEFLNDLSIKAKYNSLKVISSYQYDEDLESINKTLITFNIMQDLIKTHKILDYSYVAKMANKIYNYEINFNKKTAGDLIYQKEFKNNGYTILSININLNENIDLNYFLNWKKIYQEFFKQVKKVCIKNKSKSYRVVIPINVFYEFDFSDFADLINVKIYVSSFKTEEEYLMYKNYFLKINLNNKRFGLYVENIEYAWDILRIAKPKNLWIVNSIYKNKKFDLNIEYFLEKVKSFVAVEKINLDK